MFMKHMWQHCPPMEHAVPSARQAHIPLVHWPEQQPADSVHDAPTCPHIQWLPMSQSPEQQSLPLLQS